MKFGKLLRATVEARMPQWRDFIVDYKALKQALNREVASKGGKSPEELTLGFSALLDPCVEKANSFYMDRIEEGVILLHALRQHTDQLCVGRGRAELRTACQRSLVSLHFQLLLLQHFVALNFTAVTKMLKKFEKKLQVPLRNDYIGALVELPFYRCEALGELVEETERQFAMLEQRASTAAATCGAEPPQANPPSQQRSQPQPASACIPPPPPVGAAAIPACAKAPVAV